MIAKKEHINSNEPATKGDLEQLREDLQADMVNNFATKDDISELRSYMDDRFATKDDLKAFATKDDLKRFATKDDLKAFEVRFTSKIESMLAEWSEQLFGKIDVAVENRQIELGAAKSEQVETNTDRLDRHENRIHALEKQTGIPTDRY